MTVRKRRHIARIESKSYVNDYVKNLILDKKDSFYFNTIFVSLQPKRRCNRLHKNTSYKFSTATAILGCLKQTTIKNN